MFGWLFGKERGMLDAAQEEVSRKLLESLVWHLKAKFRKEGVVPHLTAESEASRNGYKLLVVLGWNPEWSEEKLKSQVQRINDECRSFAEKNKRGLLISGPHFVAGGALALFVGLTSAA